ncbi:hypothetical protein G8764_05900 [Pseudomaricurvus alcaniphilus]|uniref:hypothetical protein n=1 Tax=Pseudomaricurvus alcaniphilus TaxID=1166482 RepID=UPI0014090F0F|nr:hypothetical protein [Pseudomaricurvus alcaniphilus]NHN36825.1 hypothetical protein [Pseudomaricurvus alcaniphilus]
MSIKTGDIKQLLTPGGGLSGKSRVTRGQTGMGKVVGSTADGKHLFIPAFVSKYEYDSAPKYALLKVKAEGGRPRIVTPGSRKAMDYFFDGAGNLLARESLGDRSDVHSIEVS